MAEICGYFATRPADDSAAYRVRMYANVRVTSHSRKRTDYRWNRKAVEVPRCKQCASVHSTTLALSYGAAVLLLLIPIAGCALADWEPSPLVAGMLVLACIAPAALVLLWGRIRPCSSPRWGEDGRDTLGMSLWASAVRTRRGGAQDREL